MQPSCPRGPAQLAGAIHDFIAKKTINFLDALQSWGLAAQKIFWNNAFLLIFIDFFGEKIEKIKIFKNFNFVIFSEMFANLFSDFQPRKNL